MTTKVRFPNRNPAQFIAEIKAEVAAYFEARGGRTKGDWRMVAKTLTLFVLCFGSYAAILLGGFSPLVMLLLAMTMGVGAAGIGFAVAHDALHGAYAESPWINRLLGYSFDVLGANGYMWKTTHNVLHHTYTNIQGVDGDLEVSPYLRLSPRSPYRPIHRWQAWYALGAYSLATLSWVLAKDYVYFFSRKGCPTGSRRPPLKHVVFMLGTKVFYYAWSLVVPILVLDLPWWQVTLGWVAMHLTAGVILGVVFQLAHVVEETAFPVPDPAGTMEQAWLVHEMETTANFARRNRLLTWYVGGLNYQVEHHLFPKVCSIHYPAISEIVRSIAETHGMPYHEHLTLWSAIRSHWRMLKRLGDGLTIEDEALSGAA